MTDLAHAQAHHRREDAPDARVGSLFSPALAGGDGMTTPLPSRLRASAQAMRSLESIVRVAQRIARELEEAAAALETQQRDDAGIAQALPAPKLRPRCCQYHGPICPAGAGDRPMLGEVWLAFGEFEGSLIALPEYAAATEQAVKEKIIESARREGFTGTAAERMESLGWTIRRVLPPDVAMGGDGRS